MKRDGIRFRRALALLLVLLVAAGPATPALAEEAAPASGAPIAAEQEEQADDFSAQATGSPPDYAVYKQNHPDAVDGTRTVVIDAANYEQADSAPLETVAGHLGEEGTAVTLPDSGSVTYRFTVEEAGWYNLLFRYCTGSDSGNAILREIQIDGEVPFSQSAEVSFSQRWQDVTNEIEQDAAGNDIRPKQEQQEVWVDAFVQDAAGMVSGALDYYFSAGEHTLTLTARREAMLLRSITLCQEKTPPTYAEVHEMYEQEGYQPVSKEARLTWEAEAASAKSDQSLYPLADRTSPTVSPYSARYIRYNTIGGSQWQVAGQWIEWEVQVKESGLYHLGAHFKQSLKVNDISIRKLTIDGELPFAEAADLSFRYDSAWQSGLFGEDEDSPYLFYLSEGTHTIRLEAGLGSSAQQQTRARECLNELNRIYRKIVVVTGADPDPYRDYALDEMIPDVIEDMKTLSAVLKKLEEDIREYNGEGGQSTASLSRVYEQLDLMAGAPDTIPQRLSTFKDSVSSYGTWMNDRSSQPLELDTLTLLAPGDSLPKGEAGIFGLLGHYISQFVYSFVTDYSSVGVTDMDATSSIKIWTASGRDQAQILKQMINDTFTPNTGIAADLQLVSTTALLPSIVAGTGPDVFMGMVQADPVNMAMRSALADMSEMEGYDQVADRFYPESLVPFRFEGGTYALPDTMTFLMLFYRTDVLAELGISPEQLDTWDSVLDDVLPELQINSLMFGVTANILNYLMFLHQEGGSLYLDDGRQSGLNTPEAITAMERYSMLYTQYGLPFSYDFANRFRTGDMPVGIADYTMYNQLTVFAPEIKGLWSMQMVPGTVQEDGSIDHSSTATITGSAIMAKSTHQKEAWEFLRWWTEADTQQEYGVSLESVVGPAARYNSANVEAMNRVEWDYGIKENLMEQLESVKAYPEVPGGYLSARYYDFAFRYIAYDGDDIRQTMSEAVDEINREIRNKRDEYNLD